MADNSGMEDKENLILAAKEALIAKAMGHPEYLLDQEDRLKPYQRNLQRAEIMLQMTDNNKEQNLKAVAYNVLALLAYSANIGYANALKSKLKPISHEILLPELQSLMVDLKVRKDLYMDWILMEGEDTPEKIQETFVAIADLEPFMIDDAENHGRELDWKNPEAKREYVLTRPLYQAAGSELAYVRLKSLEDGLQVRPVNPVNNNPGFNSSSSKFGFTN